MTLDRLVNWSFVVLGSALLAALFTLYRNPLFEAYLTRWGLC